MISIIWLRHDGNSQSRCAHLSGHSVERLQVAVELLAVLCPVEDKGDTKPGPDPSVVD